jgi:phasin family protein
MTNFQNNPLFNFWKELPGMDFNHMNEMQKHNAKAFSKVGQTAMEVTQSLMHRQSEMAQSAANEAFNIAKHTNFSNPNDVLNKHNDMLKNYINNCSHNFHEMSEMVFKSTSEMFNTLSKRAAEYVEEYASLCQCKKAKA